MGELQISRYERVEDFKIGKDGRQEALGGRKLLSLWHVASAWYSGWEHEQKQGPLQRLYNLIFKVTERIHLPLILVEQLQANP